MFQGPKKENGVTRVLQLGGIRYYWHWYYLPLSRKTKNQGNKCLNRITSK